MPSCPSLCNYERIYLFTLLDSVFKRTPTGFLFYHGTNALVTQKHGVQYGVANGTRCIVARWQFPTNTTLDDFCCHGVQACLSNAPVECVCVEVTNARLKKRAPSQNSSPPPLMPFAFPESPFKSTARWPFPA